MTYLQFLIFDLFVITPISIYFLIKLNNYINKNTLKLYVLVDSEHRICYTGDIKVIKSIQKNYPTLNIVKLKGYL